LVRTSSNLEERSCEPECRNLAVAASLRRLLFRDVVFNDIPFIVVDVQRRSRRRSSRYLERTNAFCGGTINALTRHLRFRLFRDRSFHRDARSHHGIDRTIFPFVLHLIAAYITFRC